MNLQDIPKSLNKGQKNSNVHSVTLLFEVIFDVKKKNEKYLRTFIKNKIYGFTSNPIIFFFKKK